MEEGNGIKYAIYARFSSNKQKPTSIDDQIRICCRFGDQQGWDLSSEHIYKDFAISASSIVARDQFKKMLSLATSSNSPFQWIIVDDTSRVARNTIDALEIFSLLSFYGVHVSYVSQGIDTASDSAEDLITINGLADSRFLKILAKKTYKGMEGKVLKGFSAGGHRYGYRSEPVYSGKVDIYGEPERDGCKLHIKPDEADTVVRIFSMYGEEKFSGSKIVKILNKEFVETGLPIPPNKTSWTINTVQGGRTYLRGILNNKLYIGKYHWNKTGVRKGPKGLKKTYKKDKSDWKIALLPELQVVPIELWETVQKRREEVRRYHKGRYRSGKPIYSPKLLTGLLKCGNCGGNIVIVYGGKYAK